MKHYMAAALVLVLVAPVLAEPSYTPPPAAVQHAGVYTLSGASEGQPSCPVKLNTGGAIGGWQVAIGKSCRKKFHLQDAAAWTVYPDGAIGFINPIRKVILKLEATSDGDYLSKPDARGFQAVLTHGDARKQKPLTPSQRMSGAWSLRGLGGTPRCAFTLTSDAAGGAGTLALKPGCAPQWAKKDWASWTLRKSRLTLADRKGKTLQTFKQDDVATFEGDTPSGDPIFFAAD